MFLYKKVNLTWVMKLILTLISVTLFISCSKNKSGNNGGSDSNTVDAEIIVYASQVNQAIKGFGCATVFNPPNTTALTPEDFDRLFGSGAGQVGLNILRIRIASDDAWRATELNHAKAAIQRGAQVFASPWSPPARMKTNNNIIGGKLIPDSAVAYAKYLNDFAQYMQANGAPLYAVSVQNEPDWEPGYEGCVWTAEEMRDFLKNQGALVTATRLMAPELVNNNQAYVNTVLSDNAAVANLDIVGTHLYGGGMVENQLAKTKGLEVWMTEHLDTLTAWNACMNTAVEIHDCFTKANFNAYIWWYGKRFYGLIGQDGAITKRGIVVSQFSRFIKSGSVRLTSSLNTRPEVLISAYKSGTKTVLVLINRGVFAVKQKISFQDVSPVSFIPYTTTASVNTEKNSAIQTSGNSITYTLPAVSITTLVEQ